LRHLPDEEQYETLGGFVMLHLGRVPQAGDGFEWGGRSFEVMDMDGKRVDKVLVMLKPVITAQPEDKKEDQDHSTK
jgi:putative hemolysin